jgi:hypothetical protein
MKTYVDCRLPADNLKILVHVLVKLVQTHVKSTRPKT